MLSGLLSLLVVSPYLSSAQYDYEVPYLINALRDDDDATVIVCDNSRRSLRFVRVNNKYALR